MSFYVYENWTAENKAVIHRSSCGACNEGRGCHKNPLGKNNGKWHRAFDSVEEARTFAKNTGRAVRQHRYV